MPSVFPNDRGEALLGKSEEEETEEEGKEKKV